MNEIVDEGGEVFYCCSSSALVPCVAAACAGGTGGSFCALGPARAWGLVNLQLSRRTLGPPNRRNMDEVQKTKAKNIVHQSCVYDHPIHDQKMPSYQIELTHMNLGCLSSYHWWEVSKNSFSSVISVLVVWCAQKPE
jgi:hypothetical protein